MNENFYGDIVNELMKALRGTISQANLANKIGVEAKLISKLETGQKRVYWSNFISITHALNISVSEVLEQLLSLDKRKVAQSDEVSKMLIGNIDIDKISKKLDVSTSTIRRWCNNEVEIQLIDVLKLLNLRGALFNFIGRIVDIEKVQTLHEKYTYHKNALHLFANHPEASPIMLCLSLDVYRERPHEEGHIADILGITIDKEKEVIKKLYDADLIELSDNRYKEKNNYIGLNWSSPEQQKLSHQVKLNWLKSSLNNFKDDFREENSSLAFQAYAVDKKIAHEIQQEIRKFNLSIHRILEQESTGPVEDIYLFTHQTVKLNKHN